MTTQQRIDVVEAELKKLQKQVDDNYLDIEQILRLLRKYYPQEFTPGGKLKRQN